jgi:hypothetical protein
MNMNSDVVADHLTDSLRVRLLTCDKAVSFKQSGGFSVMEDSVMEAGHSMSMAATGGTMKKVNGVLGKMKAKNVPLSSLSENVLVRSK